MRWCLLLFVVIVALTPGTADDNWPAFRGPTGDGSSDAKGIVTKWSETENVRWKTAIHGKGWSSPVVWGDQVWVTTSEEEGGDPKAPTPKTGGAKGYIDRVTLFAVAVDRKTGKVLHDIKLASEEKPAYCHPFNSYASPTPAIEAGRVYAHFGSHGTWCLDTATGKPVWERRDLKCDHFRGPGSSPVLVGNLLVLIFDGFDAQFVCALDKATGNTVWKTDRNIKYRSDNPDYYKAYATARVVEVDGKPQLVCPSAECTIAYDPQTGAELWRLTHNTRSPSMNGAARPVAGHGLIFLTTGNPATLIALKQGSLGAVPKAAIAWELDKGIPTRPSLILHNDLLFMTSDQGIASCVEAKTGKVLWSERLDGDTTASPVLVNGLIYSCNQAGKTFVFEAGRTYNLVATNRLDVSGAPSPAGFMASPAVSGDALLLRTRTHLYSIGKK